MREPSPPQTLGLEMLRREQNWSAALVHVSGFPAAELERALLKRLIRDLTTAVTEKPNPGMEVLFQLEQLRGPEIRSLYSAHAKRWLAEVGLGVWPDREPPAMWSKDDFMDPSKKPRPLMFQVFRITTSAHAKTHALDLMLGLGPMVQMLFMTGAEKFYDTTQRTFRPKIQDESFCSMPFFVPLLEGKTVVTATLEQLEMWLCGSCLYIRESMEDQGVLIVANVPLEPHLQKIGVVNEHGSMNWRYPKNRVP